MAGYVTNPNCPIHIQRVSKSQPVEEYSLSGEPLNNGPYLDDTIEKINGMSCSTGTASASTIAASIP
jgi:hypothetical protein